MVVYFNNIANNYYLQNQLFSINKEKYLYFLVAYFLLLCMYQLAEYCI